MPRSPEPAREALLAAGARLFAQRGVDAVPVGDVVIAAGQRNSSAVQYHFGDKQGLLDAILDPYRTRIDAERVALLDELNDPPTIDAVVDILVRPLAALLNDELGRHYLMIQAQLVNTGNLDAILPLRPGLARSMALLTEFGRDDTSVHRNALTAILLLHGLADFARRNPDADSSGREAFTSYMGICICAIIGTT